MSRRSAKWNGASKEAQKFKQLVMMGEIALDASPKAVKEAHADILGKFSVKQVENAMIRLGESEIGHMLRARNTQGKVDCRIDFCDNLCVHRCLVCV